MKKAYGQLMFRMSAAEHPLYMGFYKKFYKPRADSLDEFLDSWSREHGPVHFLQIGANDGISHDPLHKFIKRDRWSGVMLEPQPDVYEHFLTKIHRLRPEIKTINAALDTTDGSRPLYRLSVSNERWATGLSSFIREVLEAKVNDPRVLKHARRQGVELPGDPAELIIDDRVRTISPESLLKQYGGNGFDLVAIDTEGFDFEILKMLDLDRISPEVIIYEEVHMTRGTREACRSYLEEHRYQCRTISKDVVAVRLKEQ